MMIDTIIAAEGACPRLRKRFSGLQRTIHGRRSRHPSGV